MCLLNNVFFYLQTFFLQGIHVGYKYTHIASMNLLKLNW